MSMTNGEKIRKMSDEELVNVLRCSGNIDGKYYDMDECASSLCDECKLKWLKEEEADES
jgi:hypothetical protein